MPALVSWMPMPSYAPPPPSTPRTYGRPTSVKLFLIINLNTKAIIEKKKSKLRTIEAELLK
jgi:hypothetical protein